MVTLRADENRYLVNAAGRDEALVKRIPGCRFVAGVGAFQLPRQPGSIIALDRLLGEAGWEHPADLGQEVAETRSRQPAEAQQGASVSLSGQDLAVECAFGDKELVKLVPGYRWSAPLRRWFLPASPMALDLLRELFGEKLAVDEAARTQIELKRKDEDAALARARLAAPPIVPSAAVDEPAETSSTEAESATPPPGEQAILERLDRLAGAVEQLVALIRGGAIAVAVPAQPAPAAAETGAGGAGDSAAADWRELLARIDADAADARDQANRLAQTGTAEAEPALRAVAGLAMVRTGQHEEALAALRRALERQGLIEDDLAREAVRAYTTVVLALVATECGPVRWIGSEAEFRDLLLEELVSDTGFDDERIGSQQARARLEYLVNDPVLRRIAPQLSDYCRVAHLLGVARGGQWMAATRITDILQEQTIGDEGFAFGLILLANALFDQKCVSHWDKAWPRADVAEVLSDLSWLVSTAERRLKASQMDAAMAEPAALACLACIAGGPADWASMNQRKALVQFVSLRHGARRQYAEFLAAFEPARGGQKSVLGVFPGWTALLAMTRLSKSAPYLMDVAANDSGGAGSLTWAVAEDAYLQALGLWGLDDPQAEMIDLLDLLEAGKRPSQLVNRLAEMVEDEEFPGAALVPRELRKRLYQRALQAATDKGYDRDTVSSFDRYVRALRDEGASTTEEVRALCQAQANGTKAVRGPALTMLLNLQLENGEPFEETADAFVRQFRPGDEPWEEFAGLGLAYPKFREHIEATVPDLGLDGIAGEQVFAGRRVVIAGGHPSLRKHALPVLEGWGIEATWFGPDEVKGDRALDAAKGAAEVVIVNTACIGHAGSNRVKAAAENADKRVCFNHGRGAGSLIMSVWAALGSVEAAAEAGNEKASKAKDRRKLLR